MEEKEFAEFVQRLEMREPRSGCLADEQLAALASGATGEVDAASLRGHLSSCLACLQAYASLQALLALPLANTTPQRRVLYEATRAHLSRLWTSIIARTRHAMSVPVPLAWSAGAVVIATLLIHFVAFRSPFPGPHPVMTSGPPVITTAVERPTTSTSSPCGSRRWRIESVVTRNLISHLFVCGDGGPDDVVYVISGRPTEVTQRPDQTSAILEQARIHRLDGS
jgi:hypothetical protein